MDLLTQQKFSYIIEQTVLDKNISYMDAIVWWCEQNDMEIETAAKLVNDIIKEKLRFEAEELHFMEKSSRLPI